jgi:allantoinase
MDYELIVRNAAPAGEAADGATVDVALGHGIVAALAAGGTLAGSAAAELDATGLHLLPGGIDAHVHCNEPGRTDWEGFATASAALATGGFTAYLDMPLNARPATVDVAAFDAKLARAKRDSLVDFGLWGGLVPGNRAQLEPLHARGVVGFKAFMCETGIPDFRPVDDTELWEGMREIAALGSILAVHAESETITATLTARARAAGSTDAAAYLASRPPVVESEAIACAIALAADTRCRLHIVHVSTDEGVALVQAARARGIDVSWETTPHHLLFVAADVERIGPLAKCSPVVHDETNRARLWQAVTNDPSAIIASDHSPAPPQLKAGEDFFSIWGGISSCQTTLGTVLAGLADEPACASIAAAALAANPARRFGLAGKGAVEVGRDADLVLLDLAHTWTLRAEELRYRHPHSPFVGRQLRGAVRHVFARGERLVDEGTPRATDHRGHLLRPRPPDGRPGRRSSASEVRSTG